MPRIHPLAAVDRAAEIAEDVEVGPFCIVEADVRIGAGCVLRPHAVVRRFTLLGEGNLVDSFAVLGGLPQDLKFPSTTRSYLRIGDRNVFREGVTISRATVEEGATTIGSDTYWMANSHAGHDVTVHDKAILVNAALVGGHAEVGPRAILSGGASVHQFTWMGEMCFAQGNSGLSSHCPPYVMLHGVNMVAGLNLVGLKRAGFDGEQRRQIHEAFDLTFRARLPLGKVIERMDACTDWQGPAASFRSFVHRVRSAEGPYRRPLVTMRHR